MLFPFYGRDSKMEGGAAHSGLPCPCAQVLESYVVWTYRRKNSSGFVVLCGVDDYVHARVLDRFMNDAVPVSPSFFVYACKYDSTKLSIHYCLYDSFWEWDLFIDDREDDEIQFLKGAKSTNGVGSVWKMGVWIRGPSFCRCQCFPSIQLSC